MSSPHEDLETGLAAFTTTRWALVAAAADADPEVRRRTLDELCRLYWRPVYAYLRRRHGLGPHDAEDMTQGFFEYVIKHEVFPDHVTSGSGHSQQEDRSIHVRNYPPGVNAYRR